MIEFEVIGKRGGGVRKALVNETTLDQASVVRIGLPQGQIKGMRRVGNDLVITAVSGEVITVREFFTSFDGNKSDLVLSDDKGGLWLAKLGEGQGALAADYSSIDSIEPLLLHQDFNFGVLPWLVGGGLALAGAAGGGGGGGGGGQQLPVLPLAAPGDTTPPGKPTVNPANASSITGTAEPGTIVKVTDSTGKEIGSATVAPDGSYVVHPTTPPPHGMELRVVAVDRAGNASPDARTTVDSTPPQVPTIDPTDGSPITGTAEPGSVVTVIDANGTVIGQTTAAQNGAYSITPATPLSHGTVINVVAADAVGNVSQPATTTVDSAAPARPTVNPTDGSPVTGTAEPGSLVTIKDSAGKVIGSATAAPNGTYAVTPTTPPPHGTVISVVATDPAGNASLPATATVDSKAPDAPTVNPTAGSPITGTAEAGTLVTIRDDSGKLVGSATVAANGTYRIAPATPPANGTQLRVVATDAAGNASPEARATVDSARPDAPTVNPTDGSPITGTAEAGSVVTIKDGLGNVIGSTTAAVNGAYSFTPAKPPADGTVINVVATDAAGNASLPATTKVDSTPPAAPTVSPTNGNPITGTAEAGSVVTIKDGLDNVIGSTTAGPNGTYAITPAQPPADGTVINVVATDAAGNASQPATATVDSTPPAAPKVNPTNGNQIAGTAEAGAVVTIKDDSGKVIGSATVAANGTYTITPATPPVDGAVLHVAATDAAGNTSPETKATVDRTPPAAPKVHPTDGDPITGTAEPGSVVTIKDGLGNIVGSATAAANGTYRVTPATVPADGTVLHVVATDAAGNTSPEATTEVDSTAVDMPTVNPTSGRLITGAAEAGSLVTIKDDAGNLIGSATAGPNGTYSVTPAATLPDGTVLHVVATDAAGNPSPEATATVDSKPPAAPTINPTNGSAITGTAEADSVVTIKDGAGNVIGTTVALNGKYSIAPAATLPEGTVLRAAAADAAGNTSPEATATVDRAAPVISVAIVNDANNDGFINASEKGADVTVKVTLVSGAAVGDVISLTDGTATPSVTLTAADVANGFVNVSFANPAEGRTLRVSATSRDLAGNVSTSAVADSAVLDTTPPAAVIAAVTDNAGPVRGPLANGSTTDDTMPTFGGSGATPGDVIKVFDNGSVIGSATVDASGSWSVKPGTSLGEGAHSITQTATDAAGNASAAGAPLDFKVDTTGVPVSLKLASGRQPKTFPDGFTDETSPTLEGKTTAGAVVTVTEGANVLGSTTADASGNWRLALPVQSEGAHQYTATAVNAAGTNSKAALALTIDATPPAVPSIAEAMDDAGSVRGPLANAGFTDDTTPTFAGSGATPGDKIRIYDNGIAIGSTTVEADGSWKFAFTGANTPLKQGVHRFTATALDPVGNESAQSPALIVTVDTTAPPPPAAATSYADDAGAVKNPASVAATTDDTTPGINIGTVAVGLTPSLYVEGIKVAATYDPATGTLTPSNPLAEGEHQLSYTLTDQAGNESPRSGAFRVGVDTTPPLALDASRIEVLDNVGAVKGPLAAGAQTDDSKPEYTGKADPAQVSSINIYDNGKLIGSTAVNADGSWRFTPDLPLAEGAHSLTAQAVDAAGNVSVITPASTFTLVGDRPTPPAITGVSDDRGSVSGNIAKDASTDDTTPTLSGTGTVGTVVTVYADGVAVGSASVAANGTWSVTTSPLSGDGVKNLSAVAVDGAGQASLATGLYPIVLDTTAPATPGVVAAVDDQGAVTGPITAGGTTDDASPTFGGNGVKAGDTVRVYDGATLIGSTTAATDGAWSVTPSKPLGEGAHSITHTVTDAAGNTSAASAPLDFKIDTTDVVVSITHAADDQGSVRGNLAPGARTDDTTPTLEGKATAGAIVTVKEGATVLGSTTADANGNWSLTLPVQGEGAHEYKATAVNAAGKNGEASLALTIDTSAPDAPRVAAVADDVGSVQGALVNGAASDDTTPTLTGSGATPGDVIKIYDNGSTIGSTAVGANGSWSFTPTTPLTEGAHRLTATAIDPVGNESRPSGDFVVNVDTTAPAAPAAVTSYADDAGAVKNPASVAKTTDDATPGINIGTLAAGSTPSLYIDGVKVAATYDPLTGTLTPTNPLGEGTHQFSYTLTDPAGNESRQSPALAVAVDTSAPNVPPIAAATDDVGSVKGPLASGSTTDDTLPTLAGSGATPGDVVKVYDNGSAIGSTAVKADGSWSFTPATPLAEGAHQLGYTLTDAAGNESKPSPALAITVDTTAPAAPAAATGYADDVGAVKDPKSVAATTDDTTPGLNIGTVPAGSTPSLYVDGTKVAATYDPATGTLTPTNPLGEGAHRISYTLTDPAGNESPPSGSLAVTVDTTAPSALDASKIQVLDDVGAVTGPIAAGAQTDDSKPAYVGKADPAQVSSVNVYDNGKLIGSTAVNADGSWRFEPALPLATGPHSLTAQAVDAAGNVSAITPASTFTVLGDAPAAPAITGVSDDKGSVSGSVAQNASTDDTTLTLNGTGTAGTVVIVRADGVPVGSASVAANGTWSVTTSPLGGDGVKNLSAVAVDGAGQASPATGIYPIVLDTTPPPAPGVVVATDDIGSVQGPLASGGTSDDTTPTFTGSGATPGDVIQVYDNGSAIGSTTVKADGSWSFTPSTPLSQGAHSITQTVTDAAGNTSVASAPLDFKVDTTDVVVSIAQALDDKGSRQGNLASGSLTDDTTPTLVGTATAGAVVTVKEGTVLLGSTAADANGNWRLTLPEQSEGAHKYTATAVNAAGKNGEATVELTFDTSAPSVPAIGAATDDVGAVQSPLASGGATDDTTPTLTGIGATPGDVIRVYDNGSAIGSTTVKADGSWSFTPTTPLAEGAHRLTATAIDPVGNESRPSGDFAINVDTTAPAAPAAATSYADDAGAVKNPASVARTTDDTTPGINIGTLTAGLTPSLYVDGAKVAATYDPATGTLTPANPLGEGTHQLSYTLTDPAGNESKQSPSLAITVDTTAPATPAAATGYADDAGAIRNPASTAATTDDTTPGINIGAVPAGSTPSLYVDGTKVDATYDLAAGTLTPTTPLGEGAHQISYTLTDAAGNESKPSPALAITVDTTAPAAPAAATSYADDAGAIRNPASVAGISDDTTPGINIGTAPAGSTPSLYVDGTKVAAAYDPATGTLTPTNPLGEGTHQLSYTLTDPAGNESPRSGAFTLNVDITAPAALDPSLIQVLDDVGALTGPIATGAQTDDSKPVYTGKADATQVSSINVYDNGKLIGNTAMNADGSWRFEPALPLDTGPHSLTAQAVDAAGNVSAITPASTFTVLGDAPAAPAITGVSDDKGSVSGSVARDASTDDTTLTLNGTGTAGTVVIVRADGVPVGSASVAANGTWSVTTSPLGGDGLKNLSAVAVDGAGQTSPATGAYPIVLDTTAPATPGVVVATDDQGAVTGPIVAGGSTDDASPTFGGSGATAGDTVRVYDGATLLGSATVKADGSWSFTPSTPLGQGARSITHTLTDAAGNTSVASAPLDFKVDTTDVVVSIVQALDDKGSKQGNLASGASTDDTTPTLVGTATPGAAVTVKEGSALLGSTTADANGNWSLTLPVQGEGAHNYTATAVNAAGKNGEASLALTIDTSAPNVPAIGAATDDVGSVQGPLANGGASDDTTPTLTGSSATPGDVIQVYDNGSAIGSAIGSTTVKADGSWSFTPTTPLTEGAHRLTATAIDPVGNESKPSGDFVINVDTTAPAIKATLGAISTDTGTSNSDFVTSDRTLVATVTIDSAMEAGATVQISLDNGKTWNNATPTGGNTYQYDNTATSLPDGSHTFLTRVVDAAGNATPAISQVVVIDNSGPTTDNAVAITAYTDDVAPNTGEYGSGTSTNDTTPVLKGTVDGLKTGDVVQIYEGTVLLGTATVTNAAWTFATPALANGSAHTYTAAIADAAGNKGTTSAVFSLTVDTTPPPQAATIVSYTDNFGTNKGDFASGTSTDDTTPVLNGTLNAAIGATDVVRIYEGTTLLGTATVTGTNWSFDLPALTSGSAHTYTAAIADAAGNEGAASPAFSLTVDTTAPVQIATIATYTDNAGTNKGDFASGTSTDDTTPVLNGTLNAAIGVTDVVRIYEGTTLLGTATVTGTNWTFATPALASGSTHTYTAVVADAAGNQGTASNSFSLTVSTSAPAQTPSIVTYTDDAGANRGDYASGTSTDDTTPVLNGTLSAAIGATDAVRIYEGTTLLGTATVTGTRWTFATPALVGGSTHTYTAVVTDAAGNEGTASDRFTLTVDTTPPTQSAAITSYTDNQDPQQGIFASGSTTNDTMPLLNGTFAGTLGVGEVVAIYRDGIRLGAATVTGAATWTFQDGGLVNGSSYSYTARVEDAAGNQGGASAVFTLTVDQTAPTAPPSIDGVVDDVAPVTGPITSGGKTNDTQPELKGSGAEPNGTVKVYDNGALIGTATADAAGKWTFTPTLADGAHSLTVSNVDAAGNEGPQSTPLAFTVDTIAPSQSTVVTAVNDNLDPLQGAVANNGYTNDLTPQVAGTISAALNAGETVVVLRDGTVVGTATMTDAIHWIFNDTGLANGQTYSYTARVEDVAGNRGAISGGYAITIDASAPPQTVTISTVFDNADPVQGNVANGGTTNDSQPELRGALSAGLGGNEVVVVYRNGAKVGNASVTGTSWSFTDTTGLADASSYSYTAQVEDAAGNAGAASSPYAITLKTNGSSTTATITAVTDDVDPQQGTVANNGETNDTTPQVTGSITAALQAGEKVVVLRDGVVVGTATMTDATHWTYADSGLAAGATYVYTARIQDAASNAGGDSNAYAIRIDTTAPTQTVTLVRAIDNVDPVSGDIPANGSTNDDTPMLEGTLSAALSGTEQLHVFRNGVHVGIAKVTGTAWTFEDAGLSTGSTYTYAARVMDAAGNAGAASNNFSLTVSTTPPPQTASIVTYTDDAGANRGDYASGTSTDDTTPVLNGTLSAAIGATEAVRIYEGTTLLGTATVTGTSWTFALPALADGTTHTYTAVVADAAGNQGTASSAFTLGVDTTPPPQTVAIATYTDNNDPQQGIFRSGSTTNDATPQLNGTFTGTLGAGEVVAVYRDGTRLGTATVTGAATWTFQDSGLADDTTYSYTARVEDAAGNRGGASAAFTLTVDQTPPSAAPSIDSVMDDVAPVTGPVTSGSATNDARPELKGSGAEPNGTVRIYDNGTLIGSATVDAAGKWSFTPEAGKELANGAHSLTVSSADVAGNEGSQSAPLAFTVDTVVPPKVATIANYADDVGPVKGNFGSGTTTDDANPVLTGTLTAALEPGEVLRIYEGSTLVGTATASGTTWTYELGNLADGATHTYRAVVADAAGNEGSPSSNFTLTVDYAVTVNNQVTVDSTPIVTGAMPFKLSNGEYIEVTVDGKTYSSANGAVVVDPKHNTWYVQLPSAIALGSYDVQAVVKSASGTRIAADDTKGELSVSAAPTVTVGSAASDPNQKATAYTLGENGMWRIHTNQTMLDASGTDSASLGSFNQTHLWSNTNETGSFGYNSGYAGRNYVQNATFMDFNRDGHMDLFAEDSTYDDGQQAFIFDGSRYTAVQVGGPSAVGGDKLTLGSANTFSWYGGVMAFDKTGDGFTDLAYGDQTPNDSTSGGGYDSQVVLNQDGSILGMTKDSGYTDDQAATPGPANSSNYQNATFDMELSGVDLNNDGKVDIVYHATAGVTKIGGPSASASTVTTSEPHRLVVATNKGDGTWENTQVIEKTFQRGDDDPAFGNGISMTWADFNGDGYMDLFMGRGYGTTPEAQYQSRILFNDGAGKLKMLDFDGNKIGSEPAGMYFFDDMGGTWNGLRLEGGPSLSVDWNGDGKMDAIELPGFGNTGGMRTEGVTGPINLYTNTSSGASVSFSTTNLLGGFFEEIGEWTGNPLTNNAVTGAIAADIDWDGDRDLLAFTQRGNTKFVANTSTVADGTSLHFRIFDAQGINALYGNTVQLFDSSGKLVGTQMINPQSGNQTNDSSAIVDFYGLNPKETYTLALLRIVNGAAADVGGLGNLGGNTIENVNAAWTGLKAGEANHAFVLTAESGTNVANADIGNGIVGTGYNDTFFATQGSDKYEGGGGAVTVSGIRAWSNTGGIDVVDYKLAGSTPLTIDLGNTGAQNTGFGTATFKNIEGLAGGSGADTFTDNAGDNVFEGRAGNDTFKLTGGGKDTLLYKLLATADATGGNGADAVSSFEVGTFEATANADRIELKDLLVGYTADADGAARYINGVATIDSGDAIGNYLSVTVSGGNTTLNIDRDGSGGAYSATALITLNGVTTDLATLLANHQLVLA
ncbi:Ig-like domain-containing protein [Variovorax paradoxus]|uniref:Ig-like domain-containing protein n=1 Tax=Variovorax paradoxus TaxID=34073 RepID=UPI0021ABB6C4|nr:Ig-like domain-containing protein [Variovorax paradoxus]UVH56699.1 Ig-like domain-containing protein [Variovorax paradoxus]